MAATLTTLQTRPEKLRREQAESLRSNLNKVGGSSRRTSTRLVGWGIPGNRQANRQSWEMDLHYDFTSTKSHCNEVYD
jgi:hypothetical protein